MARRILKRQAEGERIRPASFCLSLCIGAAFQSKTFVSDIIRKQDIRVRKNYLFGIVSVFGDALRKPIPQQVQDEIFVRSRRRCCMCYGLHRDMTLKPGQIAHLDRWSDNPAFDNLAFLCFEHHNEYDSVTRQSKNFTSGEVKTYRDELYSDMAIYVGLPEFWARIWAYLMRRKSRRMR